MNKLLEITAPKNWRLVKISDVMNLINGRAYSASELLYKGKYQVLRVGNLFTKDHWYYSNLELDDEKYCDKGDLLYAWSASFGPFIWNGPKVIYHYHIWKMVCSDAIEKEYAKYILQFLTNRIKQDAHGLAMLHMTKEKMEKLEIPLPPLSEQKRIAAVLNRQMEAVERARKAAEERAAAVKSLPASLLREVFPKPGQPLPEGWRQVKLGELCDIKGGKRLPKGTDFAEGETPFPYIRVVDFSEGTVDTQNLRYLDPATQSQISRYIIRRDDVYISIAGTIGVVGTIPDELDGANLTENAARLIIKDKKSLSKDYLARLLMSEKGKEYIKERTNQVGQPKLALTRIATIPIPLPPFSVQCNISKSLCEQMSVVGKARAEAETEITTIYTLPTAILRQAFNGEL